MALPTESHSNASFLGFETQLGFPGHFLSSNHTPNVAAKVGGLCDWLLPATQQAISCTCGEQMCLLFQVYAPLTFARMLYVLVCKVPECNGVKAFSMVSTKYVEAHVEPDVISKPAEPKRQVSDWELGGLDVIQGEKGQTVEEKFANSLSLEPSTTKAQASTDDDDIEALIRARAAKSKKEQTTNKQKSAKGKGQQTKNIQKQTVEKVVVHLNPAPSATKNTLEASKPAKLAEIEQPRRNATSVQESCFPPWEVVWEDASNYAGQTTDLSKEKRLLEAYIDAEGNIDSQPDVGGEEGETFVEEDYEASAEGDRAWKKFAKMLSQCPKQCARYCFGGSPLRMSDEHKIPTTNDLQCPNCKRTKLFELQLFPTLCSELNTDLEWGTIDVYVCPETCQPDSLVQEFCVRHAAL